MHAFQKETLSLDHSNPATGLSPLKVGGGGRVESKYLRHTTSLHQKCKRKAVRGSGKLQPPRGKQHPNRPTQSYIHTYEISDEQSRVVTRRQEI